MNGVDSKRIKKLRKEIIKELPKFPNNKETKGILESKHLNDLLIIYLGWKARLVTPRPREVYIEKEVLNDSRWNSMANQFSPIMEKIEHGEDISPYLSLRAHQKGYTPASSEITASTDQWEDKDFLLNVMGFYHLHLGEHEEGKIISARTDDVIFARIDRDSFKVIGIFDHSVFEKTDPITKEINQERQKLWGIFDRYSKQNAPEGSVIVPSMITMSAHPGQIVFMAQEYTRIINEHDSKLDEQEYINSLYNSTDIPVPEKPKLGWYLRGTDLGIFDSTTNLYLITTKAQVIEKK